MKKIINKATFNESEIILHKKGGDVVLAVNNIKQMEYVKPTLLNFILASIWFGGTFPGRLEIQLFQKVNNTKLYLVKIKFKDVLSLPDIYLQKIDPTNKWNKLNSKAN